MARIKQFGVTANLYTAALHLSGIIGTSSHPDMQEIRKIGFFSENKLHWQFAVRLLLFTVCTCV
jgi:hypothetical protein